MAFEVSEELISVEHDLLSNPSAFDFFQAYRALQCINRINALSNKKITPGITVRPALSLGYSESDIDSVIKHSKGSGYEIVTHISGLYGLSSPLPDFYNEELLHNEWEGNHASRDFLDIIHSNLLPKLYEAWSLFKLNLNVIEHNNSHYWNVLYGISALIDAKDDTELSRLKLNYAGLYTKHERGVEGLRMLVQDYLDFGSVSIEEFVPRYVSIPETLRLRLGEANHQLGSDAHLGNKVRDKNGMIKVHVSDVSDSVYRAFSNDSKRVDYLKKLISSYLRQSISVEVVFSVHTNEALSRLGEYWMTLGVDTILDKNQQTRNISMPVC